MKKSIIILLSFLCIGALRTQTGYFGLKYSEKVLSVDDGLGPFHLKEGNQIRLGEFITVVYGDTIIVCNLKRIIGFFTRGRNV